MSIRICLYFLIFSITIFFSCFDHTEDNAIPTFGDTVIADYLKTVDSSGEFDTTDYNYKVLKAYRSNDTAFLKEVQRNTYRYRNTNWHPGDTCFVQTKLQESGVDEAYRFIYTQTFGRCKTNVSVSKTGDSMNLHYILYEFAEDTANCRIIKEIQQKLSSEDWLAITKAVQRSDFWTLGAQKEYRSLDAGNIIVTGYRKNKTAPRLPALFNSVRRHGVEGTGLGELFLLVLQLSGNKETCN